MNWTFSRISRYHFSNFISTFNVYFLMLSQLINQLNNQSPTTTLCVWHRNLHLAGIPRKYPQTLHPSSSESWVLMSWRTQGLCLIDCFFLSNPLPSTLSTLENTNFLFPPTTPSLFPLYIRLSL